MGEQAARPGGGIERERMGNEGEQQLGGRPSKASSVTLMNLDFIWKDSYPRGSIFSASLCWEPSWIWILVLSLTGYETLDISLSSQ